MKVLPILAIILALDSLSLPGCNHHQVEQQEPEAPHTITVTTPEVKAVTITERYVCQIHSRRHIEISALEEGYLDTITIKEGQQVKQGDQLFKVIPILYQKKAEAELADARRVQLEYNNTKKLAEQKVVSANELALIEAKLAKAQAEAELAVGQLNFATVKAPFDGIVDRLRIQQGSLVREGDVLTTLSDNSQMWVYFNVPEARYFEYMANPHKDNLKIELVLANGKTFEQPGAIGAIEAEFNNEDGNIPFRADFPNPDGLLRNGQTGIVLISQVEEGAIVIPQRATFEVLQKRYVFVIDKDSVAHQREMVIQNELDDLFVIKSGLSPDDKIVLEGIRQVRDGDTVKYVERPAAQVDAHLKYHAE